MLVAVTLFQAWLLLPELRLRPTPLNDDAFHLPAAAAALEALQTSPRHLLDRWFPYWSLGYPLWHAYQPLAHVATAFAALPFGAGHLPAVFATLKLGLLLAFPWSIYLGARWLGLGRLASVASALLAPLVATESLYGFEYGSYVWRGSGLYTQLWAMVLLPLAVGRGARALAGRAGAIGAGTLLGATALAHTLFGYVGAASLVLFAILAGREAGWLVVARRLAAVAATSAALSAFFFVPMLLDRSAIQHSRWEPAWKWDSFGHEAVLGWLARGDLFDFGRWPLLTLLVAAGLLAARLRPKARPERRLAGAFLLFLALFFGRPTWGLLLPLAGLPGDFHLHRLIGAVHLYGVLVAGAALAAGGTWLARRTGRWRGAVLAGLAAVLLVPMARERIRYVRVGDAWAASSEARIAAEAADLERVRERFAELMRAEPGRVYPGLAAQWGRQFKVGDLPAYTFLSLWRVDAVAFLYHSMSATSDLMVLFDERRPEEYELFDIRYVWAEASRPLPRFLVPIERAGRFVLYRAPASGRIGVGHAAFRLEAEGEGEFEQMQAWMKGSLPAHGRLGVVADGPRFRALPVVRRWQAQPAPVAAPDPPAGQVRSSGREGDDWVAEIDLADEAIVFLRETYHPGWRVEVDGARVEALRVTPGYVAALVPPGRHRVAFRYRSGGLKSGLLVAGPSFVLAAALAGARRRRPGR